MTRLRSIVGSLLLLLVAPGIVAVWIPFALTGWDGSAGVPLRLVGWVLVAAGGAVLLAAFARFALQGLGTPAPIAPTRHLVVTGIYRHVRNPMYVALSVVILGQAAVLGSVTLVLYAAIVWFPCALFARFYEEPTLARTYGDEYAAYRRAVPAWIPRLRPWRP